MSRLTSMTAEVIRQADMKLLGLCCAATVYGIVLIASATNFRQTNRYVIIQSAAMLIGIVFYFIFSCIDIVELVKKWRWILGFNIGFLLLLLTPLGQERNGNRAWLGADWLPVDIQPAEIVKITFVLLLARQLEWLREEHDLRQFSNVAQVGAHLILMLGLIVVISSDVGSALVYVFIFLCMAFAAGAALRWFVIGGACAVGGIAALWAAGVIEDYMVERFLTIFDHDLDPLGVGWQQGRSMLALGSGKLWGQGIFNGTQTQSAYKSSLPERQTDFIFSVAGEELGMVGCIAILVLLFAIVIKCLLTSRRARTTMESYVCVGMAGMLIFQIVANVGMCLYVMPVIGLTLPFFSYGGSSIVTLFAAMGIVSGVKMRTPPEWLRA